MKNWKLVVSLMSSITIAMVSCSDPVIPESNVRDRALEDPRRRARANFPMANWENLTVMPHVAGVETAITSPWTSGASNRFDQSLARDVRQADGWVLVYNTFNNQTAMTHKYFILYNEYRGLLRLYYHTPGSWTPFASSFLSHGISLFPNGTSMLNFADQDVVNVNFNSTQASKVERFNVASGAWHMLQYEIAYDQSMPSRGGQQFRWTLSSTSVSNIILGGTSQTTGTMSGFQAPSLNLSVAGGVNSTGNGNIITTSSGQDESNSLLRVFSGAVVSGIKDAITSGVSGVVTGLLGGVFASAAGSNTVDVKLSTTYSLTGTISTLTGLPSFDFAMPGTGSSDPLYNKVMGVYNLDDMPTVRYSRQGADRGSMTERFELENVPVRFNPAVQQIANVQVVRTELLARVPQGTGNERILGADHRAQQAFEWSVGSGNQLVGVRVTVRVTPNNGSAPVTLAKTFRARLLQN